MSSLEISVAADCMYAVISSSVNGRIMAEVMA